MDIDRLEKVARELNCLFKRNEPLAPHLVFGVGGMLPFYLRPYSWEVAEEILPLLWEEDLPFKVLGGGSNVLAADTPLPFGIVHLKGLGGRVRWEGNDAITDADVPLPALVSESVRRGFKGLEGLGGIPGSVGGAVCMNAGAFNCEIAAVLDEVTLFEPRKGLIRRPASAFTFGYRQSNIPGDSVVRAIKLSLVPGEGDRLTALYKDADETRARTQPRGVATTGSVFRNPEGDYAGRILESLGFKGRKRGAAGFSELHANFLVNYGGATFKDAYDLCEEARSAAGGAGRPLEYETEVWL